MNKWIWLILGVAIGMLLFTFLLNVDVIQYCNFPDVIPKEMC